MRVLLIVLANAFVVIASILAVSEYQGLKRHDSFVVPFIDKLIAHGVVPAQSRERLLREDRIGHFIGLALCALLWGMLARFIAGVSAVPVFIASVALQLILLKPDTGDSEAARARFVSIHRRDIDAAKYRQFIESEKREGGGRD